MLAKGAQWVSVSLSLRVFIALGTVSIQRYRLTSIRNSLCLLNGNPYPERLCSYRDMVLVATATVAMNLLQASCNVKHSCYILAYQLPSWNMMTSSNGNIFRVTGPVCGEFTGPGEFPTQRPVTRNFDVFFDLHLNKRLSKQPWGWWFETPSRWLWRQCNDFVFIHLMWNLMQ